MSCAKTAELIEMQFGMLTHLDGSREHVLHGDIDADTGRGTLRVSGRLKSIAKHRILGVWLIGSAMQKMGGGTLAIYTLYDVLLRKELPFGGQDD